MMLAKSSAKRSRPLAASAACMLFPTSRNVIPERLGGEGAVAQDERGLIQLALPRRVPGRGWERRRDVDVVVAVVGPGVENHEVAVGDRPIVPVVMAVGVVLPRHDDRLVG